MWSTNLKKLHEKLWLPTIVSTVLFFGCSDPEAEANKLFTRASQLLKQSEEFETKNFFEAYKKRKAAIEVLDQIQRKYPESNLSVRMSEGTLTVRNKSIVQIKQPLNFLLNRSYTKSLSDGSLDVVKKCLELGADANFTSAHFKSPLYLATSLGHKEIAKLLITNGADVNARIGSDETLLHRAAKGDLKVMADILIEFGADVNTKDVYGNTPLHMVCTEGHIDIATPLIANGADVNAKNAMEHTPLHRACEKGHKEVVELLISKGGDVNAKGISTISTPDAFPVSQTPLDFAIESKRNEIAELLKNLGAKTRKQLRPKVGVYSSIDRNGLILETLEHYFNLNDIDLNKGIIDKSIKALIIIHPKKISEEAEFAIDQFILRGGRLVVFVDPLAQLDDRGSINPQMRIPGLGGGSTLERLFKAWNIKFENSKVVADLEYYPKSLDRNRISPAILWLNKDAFSKKNFLTKQISSLHLYFVGHFKRDSAVNDGLKSELLIKSSNRSKLVDGMASQFAGQDIIDKFGTPSGTEHIIAMRLSGIFKTAFPEFKSVKSQTEEPEGIKSNTKQGHLKISSEKNSVVLIGDSDILVKQIAHGNDDNLIFVANCIYGNQLLKKWSEFKVTKKEPKNELDSKLIKSADFGNVLRVQQYLTEGANVNAKISTRRGIKGFTALHAAADEGRFKVAQILIAAGADVNAMITLADGIILTPLDIAFVGHRKHRINEYVRIVDLLLENGGKLGKDM
jgi:ankyrin repeat protein